jgi:hypothetical protein
MPRSTKQNFIKTNAVAFELWNDSTRPPFDFYAIVESIYLPATFVNMGRNADNKPERKDSKRPGSYAESSGK